MKGNHVEVVAGLLLPGGANRFVVNGQDITHYVQGFVIRGNVGEVTRLEVRLVSGVSLSALGVEIVEVDRGSLLAEVNSAEH